MRRGFSVPLILIVVVTLTLLVFWVLSAPSSDRDIKGFSTDQNGNRAGLSVFVSSDSSSWDLVEYLCETLSECIKSFTSGRRWATVSGGKVTMHEVVIEKSDIWDEYSYMKLYVKPRWGSFGRNFDIESLGNVPESDVYKISDGNESYNVVILPLEKVSSAYYRSAVFSDR